MNTANTAKTVRFNVNHVGEPASAATPEDHSHENTSTNVKLSEDQRKCMALHEDLKLLKVYNNEVRKAMKTISLLVAIFLTTPNLFAQTNPIALNPENPHYFIYHGNPIILITSGNITAPYSISILITFLILTN